MPGVLDYLPQDVATAIRDAKNALYGTPKVPSRQIPPLDQRQIPVGQPKPDRPGSFSVPDFSPLPPGNKYGLSEDEFSAMQEAKEQAARYRKFVEDAITGNSPDAWLSGKVNTQATARRHAGGPFPGVPEKPGEDISLTAAERVRAAMDVLKKARSGDLQGDSEPIKKAKDYAERTKKARSIWGLQVLAEPVQSWMQYRAKQRIDSQTDTPDDYLILAEQQLHNQEEARRQATLKATQMKSMGPAGKYVPTQKQVLDIVEEVPAYMAAIAVSGGIGAGAKRGLGGYAAEVAAKSASPAMIPMTARSAGRRAAPKIEDGKLVSGEELPEAMLKGQLETTTELAGEISGVLMGPMIKKLTPKVVSETLKKFKPRKGALWTAMDSGLKAAGFNGVPAEILEERVTEILQRGMGLTEDAGMTGDMAEFILHQDPDALGQVVEQLLAEGSSFGLIPAGQAIASAPETISQGQEDRAAMEGWRAGLSAEEARQFGRIPAKQRKQIDESAGELASELEGVPERALAEELQEESRLGAEQERLAQDQERQAFENRLARERERNAEATEQAEQQEQELHGQFYDNPRNAVIWATENPEQARALSEEKFPSQRVFDAAGLPKGIANRADRKKFQSAVSDVVNAPDEVRDVYDKAVRGELSETEQLTTEWSRVPDGVQPPSATSVDRLDTPLGSFVRLKERAAPPAEVTEQPPDKPTADVAEPTVVDDIPEPEDLAGTQLEKPTTTEQVLRPVDKPPAVPVQEPVVGPEKTKRLDTKKPTAQERRLDERVTRPEPIETVPEPKRKLGKPAPETKASPAPEVQPEAPQFERGDKVRVGNKEGEIVQSPVWVEKTGKFRALVRLTDKDGKTYEQFQDVENLERTTAKEKPSEERPARPVEGPEAGTGREPGGPEVRPEVAPEPAVEQTATPIEQVEEPATEPESKLGKPEPEAVEPMVEQPEEPKKEVAEPETGEVGKQELTETPPPVEPTEARLRERLRTLSDEQLRVLNREGTVQVGDETIGDPTAIALEELNRRLDEKEAEETEGSIEVHAGDDIRYVNSGGQEFTGTVKQHAPTGTGLLVTPDGAKNSIDIAASQVVGVDQVGKVSERKGLVPDLTIGEKSRASLEAPFGDIVQRRLKQEQGKGKPAWFDGSHIYTLSGKHEVSLDDRGRATITKLHNLSQGGVVRHFDTSEYVAFNRAAKELHDELTGAEEANRQEREAKEQAKQDAERAERAAVTAVNSDIDSFLAEKKLRGKKQQIKIKLTESRKKDTVDATVYGNLAIHKQMVGTKPRWSVAIVPAEGNITHFDRKSDAVNAVKMFSTLSDWNYKNPKDVPKELIQSAMRAANFAKHESLPQDQITALRDALGIQPVSEAAEGPATATEASEQAHKVSESPAKRKLGKEQAAQETPTKDISEAIAKEPAERKPKKPSETAAEEAQRRAGEARPTRGRPETERAGAPGDVGPLLTPAEYVSQPPETSRGKRTVNRLKNDPEGTKVGFRQIVKDFNDAVQADMRIGSEQLRSPGQYQRTPHLIRSMSDVGPWNFHEQGHALSELLSQNERFSEWMVEQAEELIALTQRDGTAASAETEWEGFAELVRLSVTSPSSVPAQLQQSMFEMLNMEHPDVAAALRDAHRCLVAHMQRPAMARQRSHAVGPRRGATNGVTDLVHRSMYNLMSAEAAVSYRLESPIVNAALTAGRELGKKVDERVQAVRDWSHYLWHIGGDASGAIFGRQKQQGANVMAPRQWFSDTQIEQLEEAGAVIPEAQGEGNRIQLTDYTINDIAVAVGRQKWTEFLQYAQSKSALERWEKHGHEYPGRSAGESPEQLQRSLQETESNNPAFEQQQSRLTSFLRQIMLLNVLSGEVTTDEYQTMVEAHEFYVPLPRQVERGESRLGSSAGQLRSQLRRAHGSVLPFQDLKQAMSSHVHAAYRAYYHNAVRNAVKDMQADIQAMENVPAEAKWAAQRVMVPLRLDSARVATLNRSEMQEVIAEYLNKTEEYKDNPIDPKDIDVNFPGKPIIRSKSPRAVNVLTRFEDGQVKFEQVQDELLYDFFTRVESPSKVVQWLSNFFGGPGQAIKDSITNSVSFVPRAMFRDLFGNVVLGRGMERYIPGVYWAAGCANQVANLFDAGDKSVKVDTELLSNSFKHTHSDQHILGVNRFVDFMSQGILVDGWKHMDWLDRLQYATGQAAWAVYKPFQALNFPIRYASQWAESTPREGAAIVAKRKGATDIRATRTYDEISGNFISRPGSNVIASIYRLAMFINPGMQVVYQVAERATQKRSRGDQAVAMGYLGAMSALAATVTWALMDDEEREQHAEQPEDSRLRDLPVKVPGLPMLRMPIPYGPEGAVVGYTFNKTMEQLSGVNIDDKKLLAQAARRTADMPVLSSLATPIGLTTIEAQANYSFWLQRAIVPESLKTFYRDDPASQAYESTPEFYKRLGEKLEVSPIMAEYVVGNLVGTQVEETVRTLAVLNEGKLPKDLSEYPQIGRLLWRPSIGYRAASVKYINEQSDAFDKARRDLTKKAGRKGYDRVQKEFQATMKYKAAAKHLRKMGTKARNLYKNGSKDEARQIREGMRDEAQRLLKDAQAIDQLRQDWLQGIAKEVAMSLGRPQKAHRGFATLEDTIADWEEDQKMKLAWLRSNMNKPGFGEVINKVKQSSEFREIWEGKGQPQRPKASEPKYREKMESYRQRTDAYQARRRAAAAFSSLAPISIPPPPRPNPTDQTRTAPKARSSPTIDEAQITKLVTKYGLSPEEEDELRGNV